MKGFTVIILFLNVVLTAGCEIGLPQRVHVPVDSLAGEIPFDLAGPGETAIVVPVSINGQGPFDFVVDTGATLTCVDTTLVYRLALPERKGQLAFGAGIGGSGRLRLVDIDSLSVSAVKAFDLSACALDLRVLQGGGLSASGLLGLNFLKSFHVSFDFERNVLTLSDPGR